MSTRTATTQDELDAALADKIDWIEVRSPVGVWLDIIDSGSSTVWAFDSSTVWAFDSATVEAYGSATVEAYGSSTVWAYDSSTVRAGSHTAVQVHRACVEVDVNGRVLA